MKHNTGCSGIPYPFAMPAGTFAYLWKRHTIQFFYWPPGQGGPGNNKYSRIWRLLRGTGTSTVFSVLMITQNAYFRWFRSMTFRYASWSVSGWKMKKKIPDRGNRISGRSCGVSGWRTRTQNSLRQSMWKLKPRCPGHGTAWIQSSWSVISVPFGTIQPFRLRPQMIIISGTNRKMNVWLVKSILSLPLFMPSGTVKTPWKMRWKRTGECSMKTAHRKNHFKTTLTISEVHPIKLNVPDNSIASCFYSWYILHILFFSHAHKNIV